MRTAISLFFLLTYCINSSRSKKKLVNNKLVLSFSLLRMCAHSFVGAIPVCLFVICS